MASQSEAAGKARKDSEIEAELVQHYGFSHVAARFYHRWLVEFAERIGKSPMATGKIIFLNISADGGDQVQAGCG